MGIWSWCSANCSQFIQFIQGKNKQGIFDWSWLYLWLLISGLFSVMGVNRTIPYLWRTVFFQTVLFHKGGLFKASLAITESKSTLISYHFLSLKYTTFCVCYSYNKTTRTHIFIINTSLMRNNLWGVNDTNYNLTQPALISALSGASPQGGAVEYRASTDTAEQETSHSLIGCWGLGSNGIAHAHTSFFRFETEIC